MKLSKLNKEKTLIIREFDGESDAQEYIKFFEQAERNKIVKQEVVDGYLVSTVHLIMEHRDIDQQTPVWFETMVFHTSKEGEPYLEEEIFMKRYETHQDALKGHEEAKAVIENLKKYE